jgi:acetyl esterase/lipase
MARETQPLSFADRSAPPALLATGTDDRIVLPRNSRALAAKLEAAGVAVELKLYPDVGHVGLATAIAQPFRRRAPVLGDMIAFARRVTSD